MEGDRRAYLDPRSVDDIRHAGRMVIRFSDPLWEALKEIRTFLFHRMYRAPKVVEMRREVTGVVRDLFPLFMSDPSELPKQWRKDVADAQGRTALARIVADYIAGMTDRFAIQEHKRLIGGETIPPGVIDGN